MTIMLKVPKADLLTTKQAAAYLGVSTARVRRLLLDGRISGIKISQVLWLIPREEVDRYKQDRRGPGRPRKK